MVLHVVKVPKRVKEVNAKTIMKSKVKKRSVPKKDLATLVTPICKSIQVLNSPCTRAREQAGR